MGRALDQGRDVVDCYRFVALANLLMVVGGTHRRPGRNGNDDERVWSALSGDERGSAGGLAFGAELGTGHERGVEHNVRREVSDDAVVIGYDVFCRQHVMKRTGAVACIATAFLAARKLYKALGTAAAMRHQSR